MPGTINKLITKFRPLTASQKLIRTYNVWSETYDHQQGNLVLELDKQLFVTLLEGVELESKIVADLGCGTGRHWSTIYRKNPEMLMGFDHSAGMLSQLKMKYPLATTFQTTDNLLTDLPDGYLDCLISTLTIAHLDKIEEAIASWARVLKPGSDLIITDFHPTMLTQGAKRSFQHHGKIFTVDSHVHSLQNFKENLKKHGFLLVREEERFIDEQAKPFYEKMNALPLYEKYKGLPLIYGLHLKKQVGTE